MASDVELPSPAINLIGVEKRFGKRRALVGVDLTVPRGSLYGLVGPNGAGKTTLFSLVCGFIAVDRGTISVLDAGPFQPKIHRGRVGALPQDASLGRDLQVGELLFYLACLQGLSAAQAKLDVERMLEIVDLTSRRYDKAGNLSHGMMKRLGIAQAFLGNPELVLLDEPTNGLDPRQATRLRAFLSSERKRRTVVVSSHNLSEIESLCDHVAMIEEGRVVRHGPLSYITNRQTIIRVKLGEGTVPLSDAEAAFPEETVTWDPSTKLLELKLEERSGRSPIDVTTELLRVLISRGGRIVEVTRGHSLEQAYLYSIEHRGTEPGVR